MPYQLHATTWENDGDHYHTKIIDDLTREDVMFYLHIFNQFKSINDRENPGYGNKEIDAELLVDIVNEAIAKFPGVSAKIADRYSIGVGLNTEEDNEELIEDMAKRLHAELYELFGETSDYEHCTVFMRVAAGFQVRFLEIKGRDMTKEFE